MNEKASALLDAQVAHWLERLSEEEIQKTVEGEIKALHEWLQGVKAEELLSKDRVLASIQTVVLNREVDSEVVALIKAEIDRFAFADWLSEYKITDFVSRKDYDAIIEKSVELDSIRNEIIHHVLNSSVYTQLISDVSFHIIKQYVTEENIVVKKMPGVSSLMKVGNKALNMAAPKLEAAVENTIKKFIKDNIGSTVKLSERLLADSLNKETIVHVGENVWEAMDKTQFNIAEKYIKQDDINDVVDLVVEAWDSARTQDVVMEVITHVADMITERVNEKTLGAWFDSLGGDLDLLSKELSAYLVDAVQPGLESGYLEKRIRANLEPFFASDAVAGILEK